MTFPNHGSPRSAAASAGLSLLLRQWTFLAASALVVVLTSCSRSGAPSVLAKVGDRQITVEDFQREVQRRQAVRQPMPEKEALLREMATFEALLQRARKAGLEGDPEVQREIARLLVGKLQARELTPRLEAVSVSAEEARAEYTREISKYTLSAKARLAMLFVETNSKMSEARRAEARGRLEEARRKALENPAPVGRGPAATGFGPLAIDYSDDQASRHRGGDLGWLEVGNLSYRWPRPVLEAGYSLEEGQVSEIIETERGLYLVTKSDVRPASTTPFEQVQATITQLLTVKKKRELEDAFRQEARQSAAIQLDLPALAAVVVSPAEATLARNQPSEPPALPGGTNPPHGQ